MLYKVIFAVSLGKNRTKLKHNQSNNWKGMRKQLDIEEIENIKQAKKGNKVAFETIIMNNIDYLYRIAYTTLRNENNIEDAIQNTILKSFEKIHTLRKEEFFKTWITKILINECKNLMRKEKKIVYLEDIEREEDLYTQEKEVKMDIKEVLKHLNDDYREVVNYYYIQEKKVSEISKILKVPEGTIKSRLSRARKMMADMLKYDIEEV